MPKIREGKVYFIQFWKFQSILSGWHGGPPFMAPAKQQDHTTPEKKKTHLPVCWLCSCAGVALTPPIPVLDNQPITNTGCCRP